MKTSFGLYFSDGTFTVKSSAIRMVAQNNL